ncbi:hypothetical protein [Ruminococcus sp.]|uniref:hypothetical protein n=1 Tax=Ruminococcus sp. TaxID=41978 RepID=UPI0025E214EC|nr:hypothetical protein [Ruminococcus sp.]MCI6616150.1 hypothetical protein [Ruminococcus sp.]
MRIMTFCEGGLRFGVNGAERFRRGFRVIFDDNNKVVSVESLEEFAKVSESEQEQNSK